VLEVVEDEHQSPVEQERREAVQQSRRASLAQLKGLRNRRRNQGGVADALECDKALAVAVADGELRRDVAGEPGLADPTRAGEGY
jgi:hypothetical protein